MTVATGLKEALKVVDRIGKWDGVQEQECKDGTPLGWAYEQGWNAALTEVEGRLRAMLPSKKEGGPGQ